MGNHRLLEDSEYLGTEQSAPEWEMYSLGGFPALLKGSDKVTIEIYNIDKDTFARLDMLEGYPDMYDRARTSTSRGNAFIYYMHELRWGGEIIPNGDWVSFRNGFEMKGVGI